MDKRTFIDMVSIEPKVGEGGAGHYPFVGLLEDCKGEASLAMLALEGIEQVVESVFNLAMLQDNVQKIYFTADFPANEVVPTDFVACMFWEAKEDMSAVLVPYDSNGKRLEEIHTGPMVNRLVEQTKYLLAEAYLKLKRP